ncbi:beta-ketoacyl-ACP synthase 3 [Streptomyces sp. HU2014]|uniref:3-oxoacyl-ACP synthase n=1 Tax=Streptomyces albireticuli TaxID=1940 RepID=A0A1Z2KV56_9ACTN|nr:MULTISPECIES: beta-ketoacyl-ACP synthase 3 [Streptomyces]ARZ65938.1 3-oxoacyl-ACP synthase [Streptomyces albireticuli]UQI46209.1 beta-ketoacyl-ACP synthase 3 [Streptomyces sp. HU2014]
MTRNTVIAGLGCWLPPTVVDNADLMSPEMDAFVRRRIGIARRHRITDGAATVHMAAGAGARALTSARAERVDALVLATTTPDRLCPAGAPEVASRLCLTGVPAFDVNAGCSGFLYSCEVAKGLIATGAADSVLVIASESTSAMVDPADPGTGPLFGDGAGAVVLRRAGPGDVPTLGPTVWGSDGTLADAIAIPAGGSRQRTARTDSGGADLFLRMRGTEVLRNAVRRMKAATTAAAEAAGWGLPDVDVLVAHQANAAITGALAAALEFPSARMPSNIETVGNTAAASVPILLAQAAADGTVKEGLRVLMVAFGSGLSWAATTVTWPPGITPCL